MVSDGRVRELDPGLITMLLMRQRTLVEGGLGPAVIDARRNLSGVCGRWYPVLLDLHRFFIAISRVVFNHDGNDGTAPDPMVRSAGALPKRRGIVHAVRDLAMLLGPPALWLGEWVAGLAVTIGAEDVAQWPYTPGLLVKWVSFLFLVLYISLLGEVLGVGGISYVKLLVLCEFSAGERLGSIFQLLPFVLRILLFGFILLVSWSNGFPFW